MMKSVLIVPKIVELKGIAQMGQFQIINQNQNLAVTFQIEIQKGYLNALSVFPTRGIIMRSSQQTIKVRSNVNDEAGTISLFIKSTSNIAYNHRYIKLNKLGSWIQDGNAEEIHQVIVRSNSQRETIESEIKEYVAFTNEFNQGEISAINGSDVVELDDEKFQFEEKSEKEQKENQQQQNNTRQVPYISPPPIMNSSLKMSTFKENKVNKTKSLDADGSYVLSEIKEYPYRFGKSRYNQSISKQQEEGNKLEPIVDIPCKTIQNQNSFIKDLSMSQHQPQQTKSMEIILLAIIAAFFVALGNNIGKMI